MNCTAGEVMHNNLYDEVVVSFAILLFYVIC